MNKPVRKIVILGGGSAGWLTAGIIAGDHKLTNNTSTDFSPTNTANPELEITLIESTNIPTVGVGEGTWPSMRSTLKKMGISETEFMLTCDASFKQGSKFTNWQNNNQESYFHPFTMPASFNEINLAKYWQKYRNKVSFADAVTSQSRLCQLGLAPKQISTAEYAFHNNYGYHLDAGKFSQFLQKHCTDNLGVKHIVDDVVQVNPAANGNIESLTTKNSADIQGDLFIDCSGSVSLLIGKHFDIPFVSKQNILFNDRAIAAQVPYTTDNDPIASCTHSTAQSAGWIWDIGLPSRRGVGYTYSSAHSSQDAAEKELRDYIAKSVGQSVSNEITTRHLTIKPGHREKFWHKNCVAIGMAAGFIEPLEASALALIELSAKMISEQLPANEQMMAIVAKRFNAKFLHRWQQIIDFLKLHYVLSERTDSSYWLDNKSPASIPESLTELLTLWQFQHPYNYDVNHTEELFPAASFQFILYGMGFITEDIKATKRIEQSAMAEQCFYENAQQTQQLSKVLTTNRDLLNKIKHYGLPKI